MLMTTHQNINQWAKCENDGHMGMLVKEECFRKTNNHGGSLCLGVLPSGVTLQHKIIVKKDRQ